MQARNDEETGRLTTARDAYRKILETHPSLARVRLQLARTLAKLEDTDAARRHFEFVLGAADATAPYVDRVRADLRLLDGAKNWSAQGYVTVAPTTNMTSALRRTSSSSADCRSSRRIRPAASPASAHCMAQTSLTRRPCRAETGVGRDALDRQPRLSGIAAMMIAACARAQACAISFPAASRCSKWSAIVRWFAGSGYQYSFGPLLSTRFFATEKDRITGAVSVAAAATTTPTILTATGCQQP